MTPVTHTVGEHIPEERLVDLALGETPVPAEEAHLGDCVDCRSLHDSLHRTLGVARGASDVTLAPPPAAVWSRIQADLASDGSAPDGSSTDRPAIALDGSSADAERPADGRAKGGADEDRSAGRRRSSRLTWLAAAAAGIVIGVGGSVVADRLRQPEEVPARTVATTELATPDTGARRGSAAVEEHDGRVSLQVTAGDVEAADGYAEVWLINRDGERMVSVGVLREGSDTVSFPISQALLDEGYVVVDISREQFDDQPEHSGDSVVRGRLADG